MKTGKRKVCIKASELTDVDVGLISLVKRPANRVPYGIMKSANASGGNGMIDLSKIFKSEVQQDPTPMVAGLIVNGPVSDELIDLLKNDGFNMDNAIDQGDGVTLFPQDGMTVTGNEMVLKVSENVAMAITVEKGEGSFAEMCHARGYYPALTIATDLLQCEMMRLIEKSDDPSSAAQKVGSLVTDFGSYVSDVIGKLPAKVFKAEASLSALAAGAATEELPIKDDVTSETSEDTTVEKTDDADDDGKTGDENAVAKSDGEGEQVPAAVEAPAVDMAALTEAISKSVTDTLAPKFDAIHGELKTQADRIEEVSAIAKSAEETVTTSVYGSVFAKGDRSQPAVSVTKNEELPLLDTGFSLGR